jgi:hypothetical protein
MHLPPGFDARKSPLPRATKEAFASLRSIFSQLPFKKGAQGRIRVYPCVSVFIRVPFGLIPLILLPKDLCSSVSNKNFLVAALPR